MLGEEYPITPRATSLVCVKLATCVPPNEIGTNAICADAEASAYSIFVYA